MRGSLVGAGFGGGIILFTHLIRIKIAVAIIKKSRQVFKKTPYAMTGAPASFAAANDSYSTPERFMYKLEKSILPSNKPKGGIKISEVNEETILPNAAPIITPVAISTTLPRITNFLRKAPFSRF